MHAGIVYCCSGCMMLKVIEPINMKYHTYARLAQITVANFFTSSFILMLHSFCFTDVMPFMYTLAIISLVISIDSSFHCSGYSSVGAGI